MDHHVDQEVACYSGYTYAQRPSAFTWQEQQLKVIEIIAEWYIPEGHRFFARTENGSVFELIYFEDRLAWQINLICE